MPTTHRSGPKDGGDPRWRVGRALGATARLGGARGVPPARPRAALGPCPGLGPALVLVVAAGGARTSLEPDGPLRPEDDELGVEQVPAPGDPAAQHYVTQIAASEFRLCLQVASGAVHCAGPNATR